MAPCGPPLDPPLVPKQFEDDSVNVLFVILAKARCYATGYAGLYRRLHRLCLGLAPSTVAEDRRAAMGVPKWYLYIGYLFSYFHQTRT